jgi:hypothetical protein
MIESLSVINYGLVNTTSTISDENMSKSLNQDVAGSIKDKVDRSESKERIGRKRNEKV